MNPGTPPLKVGGDASLLPPLAFYPEELCFLPNVWLVHH